MRTRTKWLQVKLSPTEHRRLEEIATGYDMNVSAFTRAMISYFEENHPPLVMRPDVKTWAPLAVGEGKNGIS